MASIPKNITKEHILLSIERFDEEGLPDPNADSQYYDLLYNGNRYPPKVIISYANKFANGEDLDRSTFNGGMSSTAFKRLQRLGFEIISKENTDEIDHNLYLTKELVVKTCNISKSIKDNNLEKRKILKDEPEVRKLYQNLVQKPMKEIQTTYGSSSTVLLRKYLDKFIENNLSLEYKSQGFSYLGRVLNAYTWACISKKDERTGKQDYRNNAQLYITLGSDGIHFGFSYGDGDLTDESEPVLAIKGNRQALDSIIKAKNILPDLRITHRDFPLNEIDFDIDTIDEKWSSRIKVYRFAPTERISSDYLDQIEHI